MNEIKWEEKRVFITGATGFIGSWLTKELLKKCPKVIALVRDYEYQSEFFRSKNNEKTTIIDGQLEDISILKQTLKENEIDTVFHLAAETIVGAAYKDPLKTFESNIRGTYNLLEACRLFEKNIENIIVASSDKAYGISDELPYTEDQALKGTHPYDVSKSCTDLIAQTYYHTYELPIIVARCGNVYGGGDLNWSRIVPGTIRSLLNGEQPIIRSNGKFIRDYIYVKDVVNAYILLAEKNFKKAISGKAFNFSNEKPLSVLKIVDEILKSIKMEYIKPKILNLELKEIYKQFLSSKKAHEILNWYPIYDFKSALPETIEWYKKFFGK